MKKLKTLLFWLWLLFCVNFSNAWYVNLWTVQSVSASNEVILSTWSCVHLNSATCTTNAKFYEDWVLQENTLNSTTDIFCFTKSWKYKNWHTSSCSLFVNNFSDFTLFCPSCPECQECETCPTTWEILSWYILESSINSGYCIENWLCWEISTWLSTLYINDIRHESKPFIYINIPEEINWDYTWDIEQISIDVEGYNKDTDYINSVISSQISKPTSEDLWNLINVVTKFVPWLVIILFIYFVFRFIKKIF